jgi:hypothetical protein
MFNPGCAVRAAAILLGNAPDDANCNRAPQFLNLPEARGPHASITAPIAGLARHDYFDGP